MSTAPSVSTLSTLLSFRTNKAHDVRVLVQQLAQAHLGLRSAI